MSGALDAQSANYTTVSASDGGREVVFLSNFPYKGVPGSRLFQHSVEKGLEQLQSDAGDIAAAEVSRDGKVVSWWTFPPLVPCVVGAIDPLCRTGSGYLKTADGIRKFDRPIQVSSSRRYATLFGVAGMPPQLLDLSTGAQVNAPVDLFTAGSRHQFITSDGRLLLRKAVSSFDFDLYFWSPTRRER